MNMIKPVQAITAMAIAASFLSFTPQVRSVVNYTNFKLECNESTILSGFKFTLTKCNEDLGKITIYNTYNNAKKLGIQGNVIRSNGSLYLTLNKYDGDSIIDFPARASLSFNLYIYDRKRSYLYISPANSNFKLIKTVLITCNDGTQNIVGLAFVSTCSNRDAKFIVENNTNNKKIVVTYEKIGNFKFSNFTSIAPKTQQKIDLSAFSNGKDFASQKHKLEIRSSN